MSRDKNPWYRDFANAVGNIERDGIPVKHTFEIGDIKQWATDNPIPAAGAGIVGFLVLRKLIW